MPTPSSVSRFYRTLPPFGLLLALLLIVLIESTVPVAIALAKLFVGDTLAWHLATAGPLTHAPQVGKGPGYEKTESFRRCCVIPRDYGYGSHCATLRDSRKLLRQFRVRDVYRVKILHRL